MGLAHLPGFANPEITAHWNSELEMRANMLQATALYCGQYYPAFKCVYKLVYHPLNLSFITQHNSW